MRLKEKTRHILSDDEAFFHRFYEEYKGFLFYTAQKYTQDPNDYEDIVQDAVIRLLNHIPTLRELDQNRTCKYVALTVRSSFLDLQRKKRAFQVLPAEEQMLDVLLSAEESDCKANDALSARMEILALKQSLPPRDWVVLEGRYLLGCSYEELAQQLGLTQENVRMIVSRAKEKARRLLLGDSGNGGDTYGR